jgi:transposase-like protein
MHRECRIRTKVRENHGGKGVVMGMLERAGRVRAMAIDNCKRNTMQPVILERLERGARIQSDEHADVRRMDGLYIHSVVNHLIVLTIAPFR